MDLNNLDFSLPRRSNTHEQLSASPGLLGLPAELRLRIYEYLYHNITLSFVYDKERATPPYGFVAPPEKGVLLYVCKQLYHETRTLFWSSVTIDLTTDEHMKHFECLPSQVPWQRSISGPSGVMPLMPTLPRVRIELWCLRTLLFDRNFKNMGLSTALRQSSFSSVCCVVNEDVRRPGIFDFQFEITVWACLKDGLHGLCDVGRELVDTEAVVLELLVLNSSKDTRDEIEATRKMFISTVSSATKQEQVMPRQIKLIGYKEDTKAAILRFVGDEGGT